MDRRRFIQLTGISGATFGGLLPFLSCSGAKSNDAFEEVLKEQALLAFKRFEEVWDFNDFWKRGNTFDACLVFASAVQLRWPNDPEVQKMNATIIGMLEQNLEFFKGVKVEVMWADDFGWWGLMALNARKFLQGQGEQELADKYWHLSQVTVWELKIRLQMCFCSYCLHVFIVWQSLKREKTPKNILIWHTASGYGFQNGSSLKSTSI